MKNEAEIFELQQKADRDLKRDAAGDRATEDFLALTFSENAANSLRYVAKWGRWFEWDGRRWGEDETVHVFDLVREHCRTAARDMKDKHQRARTLSAATIAAVERLAKADRRHAATVDQWDPDPWLLNTPAGVIDLQTGERQPNDSKLYMTKITATAPGGECNRWLQFLTEITGGDDELVGFLQRLIGYGLTGSTREHVFAFFYGTGANGKGTFVNTITHVLGDYAAVASVDVFTETRSDRHPTDLAMLRGARFVAAQETEEGRAWAESKLKACTGGDPISARFMRQDFFTYEPQFKLVVTGNHRPRIRNIDEAMRRRLLLVPFAVTIPRDKRDPELAEKLQDEYSGILQWAIDGCLQYQREGLKPPQAVTTATDEYFAAQDTFAAWLEDCCDVGPDYWEPPTRLFRSWETYANEANEPPGTAKQFTDRLERNGFVRGRARSRGGRYWNGLRLNLDEAQKKGGDAW